MKKADLNFLTSESLIEFIEAGANPNSFLNEAVENNRLDLLRVLLSYGADVRELFDTETSKEEFLSSCSNEISDYLNLYSLKRENSTLGTCLDELAWAKYGRYFINRGFHFRNEGKTGIWTIGLTEREAIDPDFMDGLFEMLDIGVWESRFVNVDPRSLDEQYILLTIEDHDLNQLSVSTLNEMIDPLLISPNASLALRVYRVHGYDLLNLLGKIAFEGSQELIGINRTDIGTFFQNDGHIESKIYDHMKNVVSKFYQRNSN